MAKVSALFSFFKEKKMLLILGLLGLALLLLSGAGDNGTEQNEADLIKRTEEYRTALSEQVKEICVSVSGAHPDEVTVLLTLDTGEIALYAQNQTSSGQTVASVGSKALLIGYEMPRVTGVAVVCPGTSDVVLQNEMVALLRASLGISSTNIRISEKR